MMIQKNVHEADNDSNDKMESDDNKDNDESNE